MGFKSKKTFSKHAIVFALVTCVTTGCAHAASANKVVVLNEGYDREVDDELLVESTITLVVSGHAIIVCDPGMISDQQNILDSLAKEGYAPRDVTHVFVTHIHPDHTSNVGLFPNAALVDAYSTYDKHRWTDHDDNYEIAAGVTVLRTPGHSMWEASLIVENTNEGTYAMTHTWWHSDMTPRVDPFAEDQDALETSRESLLRIADWIVPGHGGKFRNPNRELPKAK